MFEVDENIFDLHRGEAVPITTAHLVNTEVMEHLSISMINTSWAPSTRRLYNRWVLLWIQFCVILCVAPIPADRQALCRWIVTMSTMYATSTVHVAMSAVVGWHALNDLPNPIRASPMLLRLWTAVRRVNGLGVRNKKALCDHVFVARMYAKWREMLGRHTWAQIRAMAWFLVGFEAGLRVSEVCRLTVCCWIRLSNANVELKVVQAKNNRWLSMMADRARLVRAAEGLGTIPSAVRFMEEVWFPFLAERGVVPVGWRGQLEGIGQVRRAGCRFGLDSAFVCGVCPPLFPTFPSAGPIGMMSRAHVSESVKFWAESLGFDPKFYSGISFRRGGVSVAATQKIAVELRMKQFRWMTEETPHVYTDLGDVEKDKVGAALHKAVLSSAVSLAKEKSAEEGSVTAGRDVACLSCGERESSAPNPIVLCDGCSRGAHVQCLGLRAVPRGRWFCSACRHRRG